MERTKLVLSQLFSEMFVRLQQANSPETTQSKSKIKSKSPFDLK